MQSSRRDATREDRNVDPQIRQFARGAVDDEFAEPANYAGDSASSRAATAASTE